MNLSIEAGKSGARANLDPENIAAVLEGHMSKRLGRFSAPPQPAEQSKTAAAYMKQPDAAGVKPFTNIHTPVKQETPTTDAERVQRAIRAAFGG